MVTGRVEAGTIHPADEVEIVGHQIERHRDVRAALREGAQAARFDRARRLGDAEQPHRLEHEALLVAHLQHEAVLFGEREHGVSVREARRDRLFDEDVASGLERLGPAMGVAERAQQHGVRGGFAISGDDPEFDAAAPAGDGQVDLRGR